MILCLAVCIQRLEDILEMSIFTGFEDDQLNSSNMSSQVQPETQPLLQWIPRSVTTPRAAARVTPCGVELDSSRAQPVTARIDQMLHGVVDDLLSGHVPALAFVDAPFSSRSNAPNHTVSKRLLFSSQDSKATDRFCRAMIITDAVQVRSSLLFCAVPCEVTCCSAWLFILCAWQGQAFVQENKLEEITQTQRDLYYQVKSELFPTPLAVANTVKDVSGILGAPREDLNITTFSGKGKVAGSLKIYHPKTGQWQDCRQSVFSIPGDLNEIRHVMPTDVSPTE